MHRTISAVCDTMVRNLRTAGKFRAIVSPGCGAKPRSKSKQPGRDDNEPLVPARPGCVEPRQIQFAGLVKDRAQSNASRLGYTLLEVIIASGIMFALIASLLSAWAATIDFTYMVNENLRRMEAVDGIRTTITADFDQSAEFLRYDKDAMVAASPIPEYPIILQGGREIRFVRIRNSALPKASPSEESSFAARLATTDGHALSDFANATVSPNFIINPNGGIPDVWNISPVWESDQSGLDFNENANSDYLRIYRYILVPYANTAPVTLNDSVVYSASDYPLFDTQIDPNLFRGMLIRQYRNSNSTTWQTIGLPLSDAIVFDASNSPTSSCFIFSSIYDGNTYTGADAVGVNAVRLKLTLAMRVQKLSNAIVKLDLRLTFPFRAVDYGQ